MKIIYGTRGSKLALHQCRSAINMAREANPNIEFEEVVVKTLGDRVQDMPLFKVGGQGLFIKDIENALLEKRIDVAVHSLKDMPHAMTEELSLLAVGCPQDPRDCYLSVKYPEFDKLPEGALLGTSSLRRRAQLMVMRNDLRFADFRGNLDSRLRKLQEGEVDAIILAAAGLCRFGWQNKINQCFSIEEMVPPVGQGLLGLQCRSEDLARLKGIFTSFSDPDSEIRAVAERAFQKRLQGGCQTPMAAHAVINNDELILHAFIGSQCGTKIIKKTIRAKANEAQAAGIAAAEQLIEDGALELIGSAANPA